MKALIKDAEQVISSIIAENTVSMYMTKIAVTG